MCTMDLESIPGLSVQLNAEFHSMNEEFSSHQDEQDDANHGPTTSVDIDRRVEDRSCSERVFQWMCLKT